MRITQNADTRITMKIKWIRLAVISVLITVLVVSITGGLYMILDDKIEGTIINEYSGRQKKPKIAICADGKYYTLDNTYGSPVYYFFEGHLRCFSHSCYFQKFPNDSLWNAGMVSVPLGHWLSLGFHLSQLESLITPMLGPYPRVPGAFCMGLWSGHAGPSGPST